MWGLEKYAYLLISLIIFAIINFVKIKIHKLIC